MLTKQLKIGAAKHEISRLPNINKTLSKCTIASTNNHHVTKQKKTCDDSSKDRKQTVTTVEKDTITQHRLSRDKTNNTKNVDYNAPKQTSLITKEIVKNKIHLVSYNKIPFYMKGNPWVVNGYRVCITFKQCLAR